MGQVIVAPEYRVTNAPVIFLAGPIQGAPDWQQEAIRLLQGYDASVAIANPRRGLRRTGEFTQERYNEQVDWETAYLQQAGRHGCVLFWLANEAEHDCRRAYAQTSRFELAEWKLRHQYARAQLAIGIDNAFTGARYIRRRFMQDCPDVRINSSLDATCAAAAELATRTPS